VGTKTYVNVSPTANVLFTRIPDDPSVGVIVDTLDSKVKVLPLKLGRMFTLAAFEFTTNAITSAIRDELIFVVFILFVFLFCCCCC
jgi:hypothetical protein